MFRQNQFSKYNVPYGIASVAITTTGLTIVATTAGAYQGLSYIAGTTNVAIYIYDSISTAAGKLLDTALIYANGKGGNEKYTPVQARYGIVASITGTGGSGSIFFSPKG